MATKKQQRRRYQQAKAHARGRDHADPDAVKPEKSPSRSQPRNRASARAPKPPSIRRVAQRSALFGLLYFAAQHFTSLGKSAPLGTQVLLSVVLFTIFFLVGMWTDRWQWNRYQKQQGQAGS